MQHVVGRQAGPSIPQNDTHYSKNQEVPIIPLLCCHTWHRPTQVALCTQQQHTPDSITSCPFRYFARSQKTKTTELFHVSSKSRNVTRHAAGYHAPHHGTASQPTSLAAQRTHTSEHFTIPAHRRILRQSLPTLLTEQRCGLVIGTPPRCSTLLKGKELRLEGTPRLKVTPTQEYAMASTT